MSEYMLLPLTKPPQHPACLQLCASMAPCTGAVSWAADYGIVSGAGKGKFAPNTNVTREQIATILFRYAGFICQNPAYEIQPQKSLI